MADEGLDTSRFEQDVVEHVLMGRARSRMLEGFFSDEPWNVDLTRGVLRIQSEDYEAQLLGTYSDSSETFLWGWANPGAGDWGAALEMASALRARGAEPGQAPYNHPKIARGWVKPLELVYVCAELAGGHPLFHAGHPGGTAFLLLPEVEAEPSEMSVAHLPGLILELPQIAMPPWRPCVSRFLERLGFDVADESEGLEASREDCGLLVRFKPNGYIADVELSAVGDEEEEEEADATEPEEP